MRRYRLVASVVVVLFAVGHAYRSIGDRLALLGGRGLRRVRAWRSPWLQHVWLHRVISRRLEAEMREDPVRALAQRRRERRSAIIGWSLGLTFGTLGLVAGLWFSSH